MKPIVRPTPRPSPPRTRVLLVRQPARSVRRGDVPDRLPLRLAIGVIVAVGVVATVWLIGYLGFRLGFAPLIRVPQLLGEPGGGLVTGTIIVTSMPRVIILAGVAEPLWLMLGFLMIAVPAAGISAVKPRTPGGPRPSSAAVTFSHAGGICAAINAFVLIWWTASEARASRITPLPDIPSQAQAWLGDLQTVAGLDVLAVIAAAVWVVLVMRLAIPLWLRALVATASFFVLVVVTAAMSMSNAAVAQIQAARSVVFIDEGPVEPRLLLGFTPGQVATLHVENDLPIVELRDDSTAMTVIRRQSIVGMLNEAPTPRR